MSTSRKALYTGRTHTSGGRDGAARSDDGRLDIRLSLPGAPRDGTNPEQLLGAGWSACFLTSIGQIAKAAKVPMPHGAWIDTEIDLRLGETGFELAARLTVNLPGIDRGAAEQLVKKKALATCPYSKALHDTVETTITLA